MIRQICNDILELVEQSLDLDLHGNCLRIRFQGLAILDGTSIHETESCVVILVSTISSVHRLVLPHPSKHNESTVHGTISASVPSIFTEASISWLRESASYQVIYYSNDISFSIVVMKKSPQFDSTKV